LGLIGGSRDFACRGVYAKWVEMNEGGIIFTEGLRMDKGRIY
jgi:hypothetical protein